jgi:hypothetical protein
VEGEFPLLLMARQLFNPGLKKRIRIRILKKKPKINQEEIQKSLKKKKKLTSSFSANVHQFRY